MEIDYDRLAFDIVEKVRIESDLDYNRCCDLAFVLVDMIFKTIPMNELNSLKCSLKKDLIDVQNCNDAQVLLKCFNVLSDLQHDRQEQLWSLHSNEMTLVKQLINLQSYLHKSDCRVSAFVLRQDSYASLKDLALLYQSEVRINVRIEYLHVIKAACLIDLEFVKYLLNHTVLPCQMAVDLNNNFQQIKHDKTFATILYEVLCILFCSGISVNVDVTETFNVSFLSKTFHLLEFVNVDEKLYNAIIRFVISFNTHQRNVSWDENVVVQALCNSSCQITRLFSESFLFMLNKTDNELWPYDHQPDYVDGTLTLLVCILSNSEALNIFYSTDLFVLFDILRREILNLPVGMKRSLTLKAQYLLLVNSDSIRQHKSNEIKDLLINLRSNHDASFTDERDDEIFVQKIAALCL